MNNKVEVIQALGKALDVLTVAFCLVAIVGVLLLINIGVHTCFDDSEDKKK